MCNTSLIESHCLYCNFPSTCAYLSCRWAEYSLQLVDVTPATILLIFIFVWLTWWVTNGVLFPWSPTMYSSVNLILQLTIRTIQACLHKLNMFKTITWHIQVIGSKPRRWIREVNIRIIGYIIPIYWKFSFRLHQQRSPWIQHKNWNFKMTTSSKTYGKFLQGTWRQNYEYFRNVRRDDDS